MRGAFVVLALGSSTLPCAAGCGRVGFGDLVAAGDGNPNGSGDAAPFTEPSGVLDPTFGTGGMTLTPTSMLRAELYGVLPRPNDIGYLAAGLHDANNGNDTHFTLFAYTPDGQPDMTFGTAGVRDVGPTSSDYGYSLARVDATRIAMTGDGDDGSGQDDITFGMLDMATGNPDAGFGTSGFVRLDVGGLMKPDTSNKVAVIANTLVLCGSADYSAPDSHFLLARYDLTGAPIASFGTNGVVTDDFFAGHSDECQGVVARPGGGVYATGFSNGLMLIAAYDDSGARISSFGGGSGYVAISGANGFAPGITLVGSDLVVVGADDAETLLVRLTADGDPVATFGDAGIVHLPTINELDAIIAQPNGKLVAVGVGSNDKGVVARFMPDGSFDPDFGTAGIVTIDTGNTTDLLDVTFDAADRIVTTGTVDNASATRSVIARIR